MPFAAPKLCDVCRAPHTGQCPARANHLRDQRKDADRQRGSSNARGYGVQWQRFRAAYIRDVVAGEPFCMDCGGPFQSTSEIDLHHVKKVAEYPELRYEWDNIMHLHGECHAKRTARGE